jgi:hypothetical protein
MPPVALAFLTPWIGPPLRLPLIAARVPAGFPSPADDYLGFFAYPPEKVYSRHYPVLTDGGEDVLPR